jgi:hypothetical protein
MTNKSILPPLSILLLLGVFFSQNATAQTYCASKGNAPWSEWIAKVQIGTINNSSAKEGYGNFTSQTATLAKGASYPLSITQGFSYAPDAANAPQQGRVWIDYNQNGTFETTELVASLSRTVTTANITIPTTALTGTTRMRVSLKTIGAPTACEIFDKGEVEDYTVNITGGTVGNTCTTIFEFHKIITNGCTNTGTGSSTNATLEYGQNIADGFKVSAFFFASRSSLNLVALSGTTTPPLGSNFSTCPGNWIYFKANGTRNRTFASPPQSQVQDMIIRVRTVGNANNPDTLYLDLDGSSFVSISKRKNCNAPCSSLAPPTITNCPATVNVQAAVGQNCAEATWTVPTATSDIPIYGFTSTHGPEFCFPIGTTPVTYTASDSCGKTSKCTFNVVVKQAGANTCLNKFVLSAYSNTVCTYSGTPSTQLSTLVQYGQNIADGFMLQVNFPNNSVMTFFARDGTTPAPLDIDGAWKDCSGNWLYFYTYGTLVFNTPISGLQNNQFNAFLVRVRTVGSVTNPDSVYVDINNINSFVSISKKRDCNTCYAQDVTAPVFTNCPTTVPTIPLAVSPTVGYKFSTLNALLNISVTDNCPNNNPYLRFDKPEDARVTATWGGLQAYSLIAFDSAGHKSTCAFTVRFSNPPCSTITTPPTVTNCPANISVNTLPNDNCAKATWTEPTVVTTSTVPIGIRLTSNYASGFCFPIGTTPVTYTASDSCGNTSKCTFNVTVRRGTGSCTTDVTPPVFTTCPENQEIISSSSGCHQFNWSVPTVTDLCSTPTVSFISKRGSRILLQSATDIAIDICPPNNIDTIVYTARDAAGNKATCQFRLKLISPTNGGSDLALSMTSTPSVYRQYTVQNFRTTVVNSGTTAFSNVKIKFTRPALTSSGGTKVVSIGTFKDYCPGGIECSEWTIPTLAGGATATLDAPVFVLAPTGGITATATLLSSTPTDNVVANNTASITVNSSAAPISAPLIVYRPTQLIPVVIQKLSPTITESEIVLELESLIEKTIDFGISNAMGQTVLSQQIPIEKGMNKVGFDVSQLPQGLYFIQTNVGKGRNVPTKFIKM